jgi:hypothetical protein
MALKVLIVDIDGGGGGGINESSFSKVQERVGFSGTQVGGGVEALGGWNGREKVKRRSFESPKGVRDRSEKDQLEGAIKTGTTNE